MDLLGCCCGQEEELVIGGKIYDRRDLKNKHALIVLPFLSQFFPNPSLIPQPPSLWSPASLLSRPIYAVQISLDMCLSISKVWLT